MVLVRCGMRQLIKQNVTGLNGLWYLLTDPGILSENQVETNFIFQVVWLRISICNSVVLGSVPLRNTMGNYISYSHEWVSTLWMNFVAEHCWQNHRRICVFSSILFASLHWHQISFEISFNYHPFEFHWSKGPIDPRRRCNWSISFRKNANSVTKFEMVMRC